MLGWPQGINIFWGVWDQKETQKGRSSKKNPKGRDGGKRRHPLTTNQRIMIEEPQKKEQDGYIKGKRKRDTWGLREIPEEKKYTSKEPGEAGQEGGRMRDGETAEEGEEELN